MCLMQAKISIKISDVYRVSFTSIRSRVETAEDLSPIFLCEDRIEDLFGSLPSHPVLGRLRILLWGSSFHSFAHSMEQKRDLWSSPLIRIGRQKQQLNQRAWNDKTNTTCNQAEKGYLGIKLERQCSGSWETIPLNLVQVGLVVEENLFHADRQKADGRTNMMGPFCVFHLHACIHAKHKNGWWKCRNVRLKNYFQMCASKVHLQEKMVDCFRYLPSIAHYFSIITSDSQCNLWKWRLLSS